MGCFSTAQPRVRLGDGAAAELTEFPFARFDALVQRVVNEEGLVDYHALRSDPEELDAFLAYVAEAGPTQRPELFPAEAHRLAFAINAYNATVMRNVINREPLHTIDSVLSNFFYFTRFVIDGEETNLKNYEDDQIRAVFGDPRVHFALNCASESCPRLPSEGFMPERLEEQLNRETREFIGDDRNVRYTPGDDKVGLSQIFEWYADDFLSADHPTVLDFLNSHRPEGAQIPEGTAIEYIPYDWTVNSQHSENGRRTS